MKRSVINKSLHILKRFLSKSTCQGKKSQQKYLEISLRCVANNYCSLPVVIDKGKGCSLYDTDGKEYLDFISGYCAVLLGHCHPKITRVLAEQARILTHTSRAVLIRNLVDYAEYMTELFCYDKVLPMNSGSEACETAIKLARRWGYRVRGIGANQAKILFAENNYWGPSIAALSASNDPKNYYQFGPYVPCFDTVPFNDLCALTRKLEEDPNICAFVVEPIQSEAGVIVPDVCYLKQVRELCDRFDVLMIADEVNCGLGRTGCLLCCDIYKVRPDILLLGEALSAGFTPVSAVLAKTPLMDLLEPGSHRSTFGGNPLGCKVAMESLKVLHEENMIQNAGKMGEILRESLGNLPGDIVCEVRGVGLLNAIVLKHGINIYKVCVDMMEQGLLVDMSRNHVIRLCPPLSIKEKEVLKAAKIIRHCLESARCTVQCDD